MRAACRVMACLPRPVVPSEMPNDVGGEEGERVAPAVVERLGVERVVPGDLGTKRHARREPVLPADRVLEVARLKPGALAVHVVEVLGAPGDVVQGRELVI